MNISSTKQLIKNAAEKALPVPILMIGQMGVGKSQIVSQVAEELKIGFIDLRLAQQEPGDLIGIPRSHERKNEKTGKMETVTIYARPEWFPNAEEQPKGILFLDELNRAPTDVRQAVFQLVKEKTLHTHKLPKGWFIVSAINPDNNEYQVETLDKAMLRRFCQIKVSHDVDTWMVWAHGKGKISDEITSFIAAHPKLLGEDEEFSVEAKPTPDQWTMADTFFKAKIIAARDEIEVLTGLVGKAGAIAYKTFVDRKFTRPVTGKEVLEEFNQSKIQKRVKKQRNDEMAATVTDLSSLMHAQTKPTKTALKNLGDFMLAITKESCALVVSKLPKEYLSELVSRPELTEVITHIQDSVEDENK